MFNIGPGELLAICVLALIVLGPQRLPEAVRWVGRVVGELRRISGGFQDELRRALDDSDVDVDYDEPASVPTEIPALKSLDPEAVPSDTAGNEPTSGAETASEPTPQSDPEPQPMLVPESEAELPADADADAESEHESNGSEPNPHPDPELDAPSEPEAPPAEPSAEADNSTA